MREASLSYRAFDGSWWEVEAVTLDGDRIRLTQRFDAGELPPPSPVVVLVPGEVLRIAAAMLDATGDA
jgi:hypothetical protein